MRSRFTSDFPGRLKFIRRMIRKKLGLRGKDLASLLPRTKRFVPGYVQAALVRLAEDEQGMKHPIRRIAIESDPHDRDTKLVRDHLKSIDVADRRKGFWLSMLGSMVLNLMVFAALLVGFLMWRGVL